MSSKDGFRHILETGTYTLTDMPSDLEPLAARMRPQTIEDVVGQDHILGPGKLLRRVIEADRLTKGRGTNLVEGVRSSS